MESLPSVDLFTRILNCIENAEIDPEFHKSFMQSVSSDADLRFLILELMTQIPEEVERKRSMFNRQRNEDQRRHMNNAQMAIAFRFLYEILSTFLRSGTEREQRIDKLISPWHNLLFSCLWIREKAIREATNEILPYAMMLNEQFCSRIISDCARKERKNDCFLVHRILVSFINLDARKFFSIMNSMICDVETRESGLILLGFVLSEDCKDIHVILETNLWSTILSQLKQAQNMCDDACFSRLLWLLLLFLPTVILKSNRFLSDLFLIFKSAVERSWLNKNIISALQMGLNSNDHSTYGK